MEASQANSSMSTGVGRPTLRIRLDGPYAELGRIPAADVAQLLLSIEKILARAASVAVGRPSRKPGRRERVVSEAVHVALRAVESGSVIPVLELPTVEYGDKELQSRIPIDVAHLGELAAAQVFDVISKEIDGHPYVVEALADLGVKLGVGNKYSSIRFEFKSSVVSRPDTALDGDVIQRLRQRVKLDGIAARQGMLVGTLVEADFESFTARLRSPEGHPVAISFDPSMADSIHEALREPATVDGWITYDPSTDEARSISLRRVMRTEQMDLGIDARAFRNRKSFAQLQKEQGVTGLFDVLELYDSLSPQEELDAYESALRYLMET